MPKYLKTNTKTKNYVSGVKVQKFTAGRWFRYYWGR